MPDDTCSIAGCERKRTCRGWCATHYKRWQKTGTTELRSRINFCSIDGCEERCRSQGLCGRHYARWYRLGNPTAGMDYGNPDARFWAKVDKSPEPDGCWLWTASTIRGYGQFWLDGTQVKAHRYAYELLVGPIPDGLSIDHRPTCPKNCVNPAHLRPATTKQQAENLAGAQKRSHSGKRGVHWHEASQKWRAVVIHNGHRYHVGAYTTIEAAEAAVVAKRNELFTHNDMDRDTDATF